MVLMLLTGVLRFGQGDEEGGWIATLVLKGLSRRNKKSSDLTG